LRHSRALETFNTAAVSSTLGPNRYEWGVDVTIAGSQKRLMLLPSLGFNVISQKDRSDLLSCLVQDI
jgi:aspartate aminotransferase-like enzyme